MDREGFGMWTKTLRHEAVTIWCSQSPVDQDWSLLGCYLISTGLKITDVLEKATAIFSGSNSPTHSSGTLFTTRHGKVSKKSWTIKVLLKFQLDVFYLFICRLYMFRATPIFRSFKCTLQTIGVCTSFDVLLHWIRYWLGHPRTFVTLRLNLTVTKVRGCTNQYLIQWSNTSKLIHTPMVCKVHLKLLKMGVARNM